MYVQNNQSKGPLNIGDPPEKGPPTEEQREKTQINPPPQKEKKINTAHPIMSPVHCPTTLIRSHASAGYRLISTIYDYKVRLSASEFIIGHA